MSNGNFLRLAVYIGLAVLLHISPAGADTHVERYFENTDHELTVYHITGREPGATMMIIGGIQGDEPGGYLAADLYADMLLEKGNLIVVPRANYFSIKMNDRGVNGDMNRKFAENPAEVADNELDVVTKLKELMSMSDVLLNLHEGSGYYSPEYISSLRNPARYGQSVIIDAGVYHAPDGREVELEDAATRVIAEINGNIRESDHIFHLSNHNTFSSSTTHPEQRGSATYNALSLFNIPAFGIETSKNIESTHTKVKYETLAINAFMREYGIIPEHPSISLPIPELDHIVIDISGQSAPLAVKNGTRLTVPAGSRLSVLSIVANYRRGLSVDVAGLGNSNDIGRVFTINEPVHIHVYKDSYQCGEIAVDITDGVSMAPVAMAALDIPPVLDKVEFHVDGKNVVVSKEDTLHIVRGDIISINDARTNPSTQVDIRVNFYGFVGNSRYNDAEDRGYAIDTALDLMSGYSLDADDCIYKVEVLNGETAIGNVYIRIEEPNIQYIILERGDGVRQALSPGASLVCSPDDSMKIISIISNITAAPGIDAFITHDADWNELPLPAVLHVPGDIRIQFRRRSLDLGGIAIRITG